jgi:hypothetical protein
VKNAILGKDLNLGAIGSFFHVFTLHASIEKKEKRKKESLHISFSLGQVP